MFIPKKYGQSRVDKCPFCQKNAITMNRQDVPVCASHKEEVLPDLKCFCGSSLEIMHGKYGVFFSCMKCGNMNLKRVLEFNKLEPKAPNAKSAEKNLPKEITVRSDDPRYFD